MQFARMTIYLNADNGKKNNLAIGFKFINSKFPTSHKRQQFHPQFIKFRFDYVFKKKCNQRTHSSNMV